MEEGTVKFYKKLQGYGFIAREGQSDIFFYQDELLDKSYEPRDGDKVSFEEETQSDGRYRATNVRKISSYDDVV